MPDTISCLTITQPGRMSHLERSVHYFDRQTHPDRELIIVHDGDNVFSKQVQDVRDRYPDQRIILRQVNGPMSLGRLRNEALDVATGVLACQWDDDDWYHPDRLKRQYEALIEAEAEACFLTDQLHFFKNRNELFWDDWSLEAPPNDVVHGSILAYREKMPAYPDLTRGEDTSLTFKLAREGRRIARLSGEGYLYIYVYHEQNAWDYQHHAMISYGKRYQREALRENYELLTEKLRDYELPMQKLVMPYGEGRLKIPLLGV